MGSIFKRVKLYSQPTRVQECDTKSAIEYKLEKMMVEQGGNLCTFTDVLSKLYEQKIGKPVVMLTFFLPDVNKIILLYKLN